MAKIKTLAEKPPEARGTPAEQLRQLRDYLYRVMKELEFLLTHLGKDNLAEGLRMEIEAGGGGGEGEDLGLSIVDGKLCVTYEVTE